MTGRKLRHHKLLAGLIAARKMSYQDFATAVGIPKGTVANWCTGRLKYVPDDRAARILAELDVDADVLFVEDVTTGECENDTEQATTGGSAA